MSKPAREFGMRFFSGLLQRCLIHVNFGIFWVLRKNGRPLSILLKINFQEMAQYKKILCRKRLSGKANSTNQLGFSDASSSAADERRNASRVGVKKEVH
jgi:hypothetical protein